MSHKVIKLFCYSRYGFQPAFLCSISLGHAACFTGRTGRYGVEAMMNCICKAGIFVAVVAVLHAFGHGVRAVGVVVVAALAPLHRVDCRLILVLRQVGAAHDVRRPH